jgi:hypothetical protein
LVLPVLENVAMSKIESEGLQLGESVALADALHPVEELSGMVQRDGTWLFTWGRVDGAISYELHTAAEAGHSDGWTVAGKMEHAQWRSPALGAAAIWVRVRALGVTGAGPWCPPLLIKNRGASARMAA